MPLELFTPGKYTSTVQPVSGQMICILSWTTTSRQGFERLSIDCWTSNFHVWKAASSILAHWSSSFQIGLQNKTCIYKIISLCMHATLYDHIDMCTYIYTLYIIYIYYIYNTRVDTHFYTYVILYYTKRIPAYLKKIMNKIHGSPILVPTIWNYNRTTETYIYNIIHNK